MSFEPSSTVSREPFTLPRKEAAAQRYNFVPRLPLPVSRLCCSASAAACLLSHYLPLWKSRASPPLRFTASSARSAASSRPDSHAGSADHLAACAVSTRSRFERTFRHCHWRAEKRFGLLVDSFVGEEELVIKALPAEIVSATWSVALPSSVTERLSSSSCSCGPIASLSWYPARSDRMSERIRVLVVDDSALMRKLIPAILARDSSIEVVGTAMDGAFALKKIEERSPMW